MDLAFNNQQRLICQNPTNQPTNQFSGRFSEIKYAYELASKLFQQRLCKTRFDVVPQREMRHILFQVILQVNVRE